MSKRRRAVLCGIVGHMNMQVLTCAASLSRTNRPRDYSTDTLESRLILQTYIFEAFGVRHIVPMFAGLLPSLLGPLRDAGSRVPIAHLTLVGAQPVDFFLEVSADIHPAVGVLRSSDVDLLYVVRFVPLGG